MRGGNREEGKNKVGRSAWSSSLLPLLLCSSSSPRMYALTGILQSSKGPKTFTSAILVFSTTRSILCGPFWSRVTRTLRLRPEPAGEGTSWKLLERMEDRGRGEEWR